MASSDFFLGISSKYPRELDARGQIINVDGVTSVKQSIASILETPVGERYFNRSWGSNVNLLQFHPIDEVLFSLLNHHIRDALNKFEKRIRVIGIECKQNVNTVNCNITYEILESNQLDNLVFPFNTEVNQ